MSIQALVWVLEFSESKGAARHVLISIANHAGRFGKDSWPSIPTIAHESRLSEREVYKSIKDLVSLGELSVDAGGGRSKSNSYTLLKMGEQSSGFKLKDVDGNPGLWSQNPVPRSVNPVQKSPEPSLTVLNLKKTEREKAWPADLVLLPEMSQYALANGVPDPAKEFSAWQDDCMAHGRKYVNWNAAWRTRVNRYHEFNRGKPNGSTSRDLQAELDQLMEKTHARTGKQSQHN